MKKLLSVLSVLLFSIFFIFFLSRTHYLFIRGLNPFVGLIFIILILLIAVPFIIKGIDWLKKQWSEYDLFTPTRLFTAGFICWIIFAVIVEIFIGNSSLDIHFHDTYFVIAHTHIAIGVAACFAIFSMIYYGFHKVFGRYLNTTMAYIHFWITFLGVCLIFWPGRYEGLAGMPRRYYDYGGWETYNMVAGFNRLMTIISLLILVAQGIFLFNIVYSIINGRKVTTSDAT